MVPVSPIAFGVELGQLIGSVLSMRWYNLNRHIHVVWVNKPGRI